MVHSWLGGIGSWILELERLSSITVQSFEFNIIIIYFKPLVPETEKKLNNILLKCNALLGLRLYFGCIT
jgi:hypothetical protein